MNLIIVDADEIHERITPVRSATEIHTSQMRANGSMKKNSHYEVVNLVEEPIQSNNFA